MDTLVKINDKVPRGLTKIRARLLVDGVVQGVGFRPFVGRFAQEHHLNGWVLNSSSGVEIEVEGKSTDIERFLEEFIEHAPPHSFITSLDVTYLPLAGYKNFFIKESRFQPQKFTLISPDLGLCDDCLHELYDPSNRRYGYPFINCTNCGPRYTIIEDIPYDRANTTMKKFTMCPSCEEEYYDPSNRRYHAQPNACRDCGPAIWLEDGQGNRELRVKSEELRVKSEELRVKSEELRVKSEEKDNALNKVRYLLSQGKIVAVKGLGGFHLVCDAQNEEAVRELRLRKRREEKPFAVMIKNIELIKSFCFVSQEEELILSSPQRPIVLLKRKDPSLIAPSVAPKSRYLGVMLPYTPLHYLLMDGPYLSLVMTSANISREPIVISNKEAGERLQGIADYYLFHNRDIYTRSDDSVVYVDKGKESMIRRSRGYCPLPVHLGYSPGYTCREVLACGGELKNTICLTRGKDAFVSQYIGDLESLETFKFFEHTIDKMKRILKVEPKVIIYDKHPDYLSTKYAQSASGYEVRIPVQHHHSHIAGCMAENGLTGRVIGLAWDGTGYGEDGCVWGGEFLVADFISFERKAWFSYIPMPGGQMAIKEPYRMTISYLFKIFGEKFMDLKLPFMEQLDKRKVPAVVETLKKGINTPYTSSAGRIFEAMASLLGLRNKNTFEGQAAIELEYLASSVQILDNICPYPYFIHQNESIYTIELKSMIEQIVEDILSRRSIDRIALAFHVTMADLAVNMCKKIREEDGLNRVVLSGGVFQNRLLTSLLLEKLRHNKFDSYVHHKLPANDGGISLGQAVIAGHILGNA